MVILQLTQASFPAPIKCLKTICNPTSRESNRHTQGAHTCTQAKTFIHKHKMNKSNLKSNNNNADRSSVHLSTQHWMSGDRQIAEALLGLAN